MMEASIKPNVCLGTTQTTSDQHSTGFIRIDNSQNNADRLVSDNGHLLTIAPTGAGKGVGCIIPTLLNYPGSTVIIDPKGENYAVTHQYRRSLGQDVILLDPFNGVKDTLSDSFNPFSVISLEENNHIIDEVRSLCEHLVLGTLSKNDAFWDIAARQLLVTLCIKTLTTTHPLMRTLSDVVSSLNQPDVELAKTIEAFVNEKPTPLANYVQRFNFGDRTSQSIIGVARTHLEYLYSPTVMDSVAGTSFDLNAIKEGKNVSIYIVLPPDKLSSHAGLLRAWVGSLLKLMTQRRSQPEVETLFIIDEAAQLKYMDTLKQAVTLLRGYGVRIWSFWQDLEQLKSCYPDDWKTIINNSTSVQAFGFPNYGALRDFSEIFGHFNQDKVFNMKSDEQIVAIRGQKPKIIQKLNYLTDSEYAGLFEPNPYYESRYPSFPKPEVERQGK